MTRPGARRCIRTFSPTASVVSSDRWGSTCRLHDLRHWHVTQALGAGLPVRDVAERVGHTERR